MLCLCLSLHLRALCHLLLQITHPAMSGSSAASAAAAARTTTRAHAAPGGAAAADAAAAAAPTPATAATAHSADADDPDSFGPDDAPDDDFGDDIDGLVDLEQEMMLESQAADDDAAGEGGGFDPAEEGGGFFTAEQESAGAGAAAAAAAAGADSLEEDKPEREFASGCRECGSIGVQQNYLTAFNVSVCYRCQRAHPQRYALLTQTSCVQTYMLPLALVQQRLGYIEKVDSKTACTKTCQCHPIIRIGRRCAPARGPVLTPSLAPICACAPFRSLQKNPHKQAWGSMKLYWKQQVLALVREKHGSLAALEAAKQARDIARIAKDDTRRRNAHRSAAREAAFASTLAASMGELDAQTPTEVVAMLAARTKGMGAGAAGTRSSDKRRARRKPTAAAAAADEEDDDVIDLAADDDDGPPASGPRKRAKKDDGKAKPAKKLHVHSFVDEDEGRQRCRECGFVVEFETF